MTSKEIARALLDSDKVFIITPKMLSMLVQVRLLMGDN